MSNIIDNILAEVCLDERIQDGVFDMSNNSHMDALRESMTDQFGLSLNDCRSVHNKMVEGKYPERQAYNKDGLLVTFPTPNHKAKAIQRGTHFEQDPSKGAANVFGGGQQPAAGGQPPAGGAPEQPTPNVFNNKPAPPAGQPSSPPAPQAAPPPEGGQSTPSSLPASETPPPAPSAPAAPAAPSGGGSSLPASQISQMPPPAAPGQPPLAIEPATPAAPGQPGAPLPPPNFDTPKTPEMRASEAQVVKQMMNGDPNNPTLSPTMPVNVTEMIHVYNFAKQMGYNQAASVILEAMNKK